MSTALVTMIYGKVCGSAMRKAVLIRMADRANDDGSGIYTSKSRIAAELECSRTTVQSATRELEEDGIIQAVGRKTGNHGYTTIYQISVRNIALLPDAWAKCTNNSTLDSGLGEDIEEPNGDAHEVHPGAALGENQVPKSNGSSANLIGKNRPYRTKEINPSDSKKSASRGERPRSADEEASLLRWEAVRLRASDPERARELEQRADDLTYEEIQKAKAVEH